MGFWSQLQPIFASQTAIKFMLLSVLSVQNTFCFLFLFESLVGRCWATLRMRDSRRNSLIYEFPFTNQIDSCLCTNTPSSLRRTINSNFRRLFWITGNPFWVGSIHTRCLDLDLDIKGQHSMYCMAFWWQSITLLKTNESNVFVVCSFGRLNFILFNGRNNENNLKLNSQTDFTKLF